MIMKKPGYEGGENYRDMENNIVVEDKVKFFEKVLRNSPSFSEKIMINNDGTMQTNNMATLAGGEGLKAAIKAAGPELFSVVKVDKNNSNVLSVVNEGTSKKYTEEDFYLLIKDISNHNSKLIFSFSKDPDGKWIEYTVKRSDFNVGDLVNWENNQGVQFENLKPIIRIEKFEKTGEEFAIFDGVSTGVPLSELIR